jgi:hypothetical protein
MGTEIEFKFEPLCDALGSARPFIIALGALGGLIIAAGAFRT